MLTSYGCARSPGTLPSNQPQADTPTLVFSGDLAFDDVATQVEFGPRPTSSEASQRTADWIVQQLEQSAWQVTRQPFSPDGVLNSQNIVAFKGVGKTIMIGAHYDTRLVSDQDADVNKVNQPGVGANDGGSGVAVLLELSRVFSESQSDLEICLAFFDAEDNGGLQSFDWAMGSRYFVDNAVDVPECARPDAMIVVDMVGDAAQTIYRDFGSTTSLQTAIWDQARLVEASTFSETRRYTIIDDHIAFRDSGIDALVIIDFDYPYWHTTEDTLDKVSPESLAHVGRVLEAWIKNGANF